MAALRNWCIITKYIVHKNNLLFSIKYGIDILVSSKNVHKVTQSFNANTKKFSENNGRFFYILYHLHCITLYGVMIEYIPISTKYNSFPFLFLCYRKIHLLYA